MSVNLSTVGSAATGTLTSTGIGSGLDINTMVSAIVNATIQPQQARLQSLQSADQSSISVLGQLKSVLATLRSAAAALTTGGALSQLDATVSDSSVFSASAGSGAVAGTYDVEVQTLAAANTIKSAAYGSATAAVTAGTYTLSAGGKSFSVSLDSNHATLSGLADAINGASDNSGVSATIVNSSGGSYLLLSATQTGVANAVSVTAGQGMSFSTVHPAADATGSIAGLPFDSATNAVSGVLTGVTLNLAKATPGTTQTLTIAADTGSAASAVQAFAKAYNNALGLIQAATKYTPGGGSGSSATSGTAGPLQGDVSVQGLMQQLQSVVAGSVGSGSGGAFTSLRQLGLSFADDGSIDIDTDKLNAVLQGSAGAVKGLFAADQGIGTRLDKLLSDYAGASGVIDTKTGVLTDQISDIGGKLNALNARQAQLTAQYYAQFNAMDSVVASYRHTSDLLTQLYAPRKVDSSS